MTSSGKESAAASTEWRELRAQVQFLDDECRTLRRKVYAIIYTGNDQLITTANAA